MYLASPSVSLAALERFVCGWLPRVLLVVLSVVTALGREAMAGEPAASSFSRQIEVESPSQRSVSSDDWRRTSRGWERMSDWRLRRARSIARPPLTAVNPLLVAALLLLISLGALLAFSPARPGSDKIMLLATRR